MSQKIKKISKNNIHKHSENNFFLILILLFFSAFPVFATTFKDVVNNLTELLTTSVVNLLFVLAFAFFFYGVVQYTLYPGEEAKDHGKSYMIWGLIALTVMFSVYGLIRLIMGTFFPIK